MARKIPVGDVTELEMDPVDGRAPKLRPLPTAQATEVPFDKPADLRKMGFDMGPGNPRVGATGSTQAADFRGLRAAQPNMGPQPLPAQRTAANIYQAGGRTSAALRAAAPALRTLGKVGGGVGVVENFNDYKIDDPEVDSSAAGTFRALREGDFGMAGRSMSKGLLETGMDVGSFVANTADYFVPGQPFSQRYNETLRNTFGNQLVDNSGTMTRLSASAGGGRGFVNPPLVSATQPPANQPPTALTAVQPKPFSDARNGTYNAPASSNLRDTVSTVPSLGFEGYRQMAENIRSLPGEPMGGMSGIRTGATLRDIADAQDLGPSFKEQNAGRGAREERMQTARLMTEKNIAEMRERGDMARMSTNLAATLRGQDLDSAYRRESLGVQRESNLLSARSTRAKLQYDMSKDQRDFNASKQERDLKASQESQAALDKQLEARFRTTDDKGNNVADTAKVAAYKTAMVSSVPSLVRMLRQSGTPEAQAKAQELEQRGPSALSPQDHDMLQQLFDTRELARSSRGIGPGSSSFVDSNDLLDYMQAQGEAGVTRGITGRRVVLRNGTTIDIDKLQYGPNGNTIWPNWFNTPSTNLTLGLRGLE